MHTHQKHHALLLLALAGLALVLGLLVTSLGQRDRLLTETGETRRLVQDALDNHLPAQAVSAQDPALLAAAREVANAPFVARLWVVDDMGKIVYHQGGPGAVGDEVRAISGRDGRALVAALSSDEFTGPQALQVYTAEALLVEGEHNDVFRPLIRPVKNATGQMIAMIGLSYEVSPAVSALPTGETARILLFVLGLGVYWLALPLWVWFDARLRGEPPALWVLFTLLANLAGLLAYLLVVTRPRPSAA